MRSIAKILAVLLVLSQMAAGCTAMHRIQRIDLPAPPPDFHRIEVGDLVAVVMKDGRQANFEVASIDSDMIVSVSGEQFFRRDMASLDHDRLNLSQSLVLTGVITVGVYLFGMILEGIGFGGR